MSVQASNRENHERKTARILVEEPPRRRPMEMGAITQRFFVEGEEQAANGYKNLAFDDQDSLGVDDVKSDSVAARDRELQFDSFDEVPRRQRPLVGVALLISGVAVMVAAWTVSTMGVPWRSQTTTTVAAAMPPATSTSTSMTGAPAIGVLAAGAPAPRSPVIEPINVEPPKTAASKAARRTAGAPARGGVVDPVRTASDDSDDPDPDDPAEPDDPEDPDPDVRASHRARPMKGYVWSPTAKAMVPSESPTSTSTFAPSATSARSVEPASAPAASSAAANTTASSPPIAPAPAPGSLNLGSKIAPADTGPPPFETARVPVPTERAPIIE